jgi:hypothetical protein
MTHLPLNRRRLLGATFAGGISAIQRTPAGATDAPIAAAVTPTAQATRVAAGAPALRRRSHVVIPPLAASDPAALAASGVTRKILAVPIAGGDVLGPPNYPPFLIHQWLPGPLYDGTDAEPNGITDFQGFAALAYTTGTATDANGVVYPATTDIRAYQGEYVKVDGGAAFGTFVEI